MESREPQTKNLNKSFLEQETCMCPWTGNTHFSRGKCSVLSISSRPESLECHENFACDIATVDIFILPYHFAY